MTPTTSTDPAEAVRRALSRDVARAVAALTGWPRPDPVQRVAIAQLVSWMMEGVAHQRDTDVSGVVSLARRYGLDAAAGDALAAALVAVRTALESPGLVFDRPVPEQWLTDGSAALRGRKYRREASRRWYLPGHSALRRHVSARLFVDVAAPVDAVWRVVADPRRTPEWSHECQSIEFLDGATEPGVGVRFRGGNRSGRTTWSRTC